MYLGKYHKIILSLKNKAFEKIGILDLKSRNSNSKFSTERYLAIIGK